jgi:hypothetical protein
VRKAYTGLVRNVKIFLRSFLLFLISYSIYSILKALSGSTLLSDSFLPLILIFVLIALNKRQTKHVKLLTTIQLVCLITGVLISIDIIFFTPLLS